MNKPIKTIAHSWAEQQWLKKFAVIVLPIIPKTDDERFQYFNQVVPYLHSNKVRLGVSDDNDTLLTDTLSVMNGVYPKAKNKDISTKTLRDEKDELSFTLVSTIQKVYDDIPESALTTSDRNTLNLKKRDETRTPRTKMTVTPFVKLVGKPGAQIQVICRSDTDSSRASILPEADGVEIIYMIGTTPPASAAECTLSKISSKARFIVDVDPVNAGKKLYGYLRWINTSDSKKNGPNTQLMSVTISD